MISICMETNMPGIWQAEPSGITEKAGYFFEK
jgi:hypothetical protein